MPEIVTLPTDTADLTALLRQTYSIGAGWALIEQVPPRTGHAKRYADAVAMHLYRGDFAAEFERDPRTPWLDHEVWGFEVKVSRGDWKRELRDPTKAGAVSRHCDRWYVVALPGVVQLEELPRGWGLMVPRLWTRGEMAHGAEVCADHVTLEIDVPAQLRDRPTDAPLSRYFAAAMLRRAVEQHTSEGQAYRAAVASSRWRP
jgi:hypothetical protein